MDGADGADAADPGTDGARPMGLWGGGGEDMECGTRSCIVAPLRAKCTQREASNSSVCSSAKPESMLSVLIKIYKSC